MPIPVASAVAVADYYVIIKGRDTATRRRRRVSEKKVE